jgi:hypothetical protein
MTATVLPQNTAALARQTGPLTVPIEIIRAAGARHRVAVAEHGALPGGVLAGVAAFTVALVVFAVLEWHDTASPLLIACALIGAAAAFTPDALAARTVRPTDETD